MPYLLETFTASSGSTASKRAFNPRVAALKSSLHGKRTRSLVEGQSSVMRAASLSERLRALDERRLACRKQHEAGPEPCSVRPDESELQARGRSLFRRVRQIRQTTMVKVGCLAAGRAELHSTGHKQTGEQTIDCAPGVRGLLPRNVHSRVVGRKLYHLVRKQHLLRQRSSIRGKRGVVFVLSDRACVRAVFRGTARLVQTRGPAGQVLPRTVLYCWIRCRDSKCRMPCMAHALHEYADASRFTS
jgi:hypothetical protein